MRQRYGRGARWNSLPSLYHASYDCVMSVPVRDLRNNNAALLARVARGESVVVTRDGEAVAAVVPLRRRGLSARELVERRRRLPRVDAAAVRADIDAVIDPRL